MTVIAVVALAAGCEGGDDRGAEREVPSGGARSPNITTVGGPVDPAPTGVTQTTPAQVPAAPDSPATPPAATPPMPPPGPDHATVFPEARVNRIDVTVAAADWKRLEDDMATLQGKFGGGGLALPVKGLDYFPRKPIYVPATVDFQGTRWHSVGFRLRGNATLASTWRAGKKKLPFQLDFDELEDAVPAVKNQRFHGFKSLAFLNGWGDRSLMREKVANDLFAAAGVPVARSAYYRVYLDTGAGPTYVGLYTAAEVPGRTLVERAFGESGGNLYKPDGDGAKLDKAGMLDVAAFEKKTNEGTGHAEVMALHAALHADDKNRVAWRQGMERVLNVDGFLKWLAVNTVLMNWDTYGVLAHNYYLYGVTREAGRLHWIPWDNGNAFSRGFLFWSPRRIDLEDVGADWPLIHRVLKDPVYQAAYRRHVRAFVEGPFAGAAFEARIATERKLIEPHVIGPTGEGANTLLAKPEDFADEIDAIVKMTRDRRDDATRELASP